MNYSNFLISRNAIRAIINDIRDFIYHFYFPYLIRLIEESLKDTCPPDVLISVKNILLQNRDSSRPFISEDNWYLIYEKKVYSKGPKVTKLCYFY